MEAGDLETQISAAYASGDADAILKLLGGLNVTEENQIYEDNGTKPSSEVQSKKSHKLSLDADAPEFVPSFARTEPEVLERASATEVLDSKALHNLYPNLQPGLVDAIIAAHNGDMTQAYVTLQELAQEQDFYIQVNTTAYAKAVKEFDEQFPALGGSKSAQQLSVADLEAKQNTTYDSTLLIRMRGDRLSLAFPWVEKGILGKILAESEGSYEVAERSLLQKYPKPQNWDEERRQLQILERKRQQANVQEQRGANTWGSEKQRIKQFSTNSSRRTRDVGGDWVSTGESVRLLYESLRAEAGEEARLRNKYFDSAARAVEGGDGVSAKRLGALGRDANERMKALHRQAADAIFCARNPPGKSGQIDLHGLHVAEALERLPQALEECGGDRVRILTGSGHHTKGTGKARLRPAVRNWLTNHQYRFEEVLDSNSHVGAFVVHI